MGRVLKSSLVLLITLSLVAPATLAAAGPASPPAPALSPRLLIADGTMKAAIARASAAVAVEQGATAPLAAPAAKKKVRAQMMGGGGGKGAMIMGLVSAVIGAGVTIYMLREMKKNNAGDDPQ